MKKSMRLLSCLVLASWALGASAQSVWTYEVIGANNEYTIGTKPPMDISYPPGNARAPIYTSAEMPRGGGADVPASGRTDERAEADHHPRADALIYSGE